MPISEGEVPKAQHVCPACGYCPCCGRRQVRTFPQELPWPWVPSVAPPGTNPYSLTPHIETEINRMGGGEVTSTVAGTTSYC